MAYERYERDALILRDELALDRTRLANERTLLSYARTAIMLAVTGGTLLKLFGDSLLNYVSAWAIIGLGIFVAVFGSWRFARMQRSLPRAPSVGE